MAAAAPSEVQVPKYKLNELLKREIESVDDYQIRVGPGWTLNDGTYEHIPQNKRRKRDTPYPTYVDEAHRAMTGLSSLQIAHNAPIHPCAMDVATAHLWRCLPPAVKTNVEVMSPNGPDLWGEDDQLYEAMVERMNNPAYLDQETNSTYSPLAELKKKPWAVWPLWIEDQWGKDWVLAAWFAEESEPTTKVYDRVVRLTVYDARRNPKAGSDLKHHGLKLRLNRIVGRLRRFLQSGGFQMGESALAVSYMSPMALDEATSGERCFAAVKELLNFIVEVHIGTQVFDPSANSLPRLSRWVNPYQYRVEMAGINAWVVMATFDFNARIAIECVVPDVPTEVVADGVRRMVRPYDLAGPYNPPLLAEADYLLPSKQSPNI
ncbi:hypothetical protein F5Y06DRAFT_236000 [Hypoxylon sp. FL0890]|nr:hypothetical protein F5Y06DRAFT_236000 [Hypoxylon sp. FL0890]